MKTQFKITFRNQFKALEFTFFLMLFTIGCLLYFYYYNPFFDQQTLVWLIIILLIPVLYLHIEYLLLNGGSSLIINSDLATVSYDKNGHDLIDLSFNQIARVVLYLPPSAYRGVIERKIQFLPIEPYGYAVIYSKEGDKILVTSLMIPDVLKELEKMKGIKIDKKKRLFASPSFEKMIQWFMKDGL